MKLKHPTTDANLQDRQAEIDDVKRLALELLESLNCAEGCETATDFDENLQAALESLKVIAAAIAEIAA